jgi:DNA-binding NarL/FixJ family response regulator
MRVAIVSDNVLCRETLCRLVRSELQPEQLDVYDTVRALKAAEAPRANLLLFDPPSGLDFEAALQTLGGEPQHTRSMVLISSPDAFLARLARRHGFCGVLSKTSALPLAAAALRVVGAGSDYFPSFEPEEDRAERPLYKALTPRQAEILVELEAGAPNKEIARKLGISLATVKMHVRALLSLVGARNRTEAVMRLRRIYTERDRDCSRTG